MGFFNYLESISKKCLADDWLVILQISSMIHCQVSERFVIGYLVGGLNSSEKYESQLG